MSPVRGRSSPPRGITGLARPRVTTAERSLPRLTGPTRTTRRLGRELRRRLTAGLLLQVGRGSRDRPKGQHEASTKTKLVTRMERRRAIRRRRARIIWAVCGAFCLLVLLTSFPARALLQQRSAINASSAELDRLTAGNKELQSEATELSNPANIAALARNDYDMVSPGETAYDVLPSAGTQKASSKGQARSTRVQSLRARKSRRHCSAKQGLRYPRIRARPQVRVCARYRARRAQVGRHRFVRSSQCGRHDGGASSTPSSSGADVRGPQDRRSSARAEPNGNSRSQ